MKRVENLCFPVFFCSVSLYLLENIYSLFFASNYLYPGLEALGLADIRMKFPRKVPCARASLAKQYYE